jgi:hypothetical protein
MQVVLGSTPTVEPRRLSWLSMRSKKFEEIAAHKLDAFRVNAIKGEARNRLLEINTIAGVVHYW